MTALICFAVVVLASGLYLVLRARRKPPELRGDWWERFERDFRAYAERTAGTRQWRPRDRKPPR